MSFSGGKDSTAMLLRMIELDYPIDIVLFADTTLEFPEMYEWIKKIESLIPYDIITVKSKSTWDEWFYGVFSRGRLKGSRRGFPYVINPCWWSRESKIYPLQREQGKNNQIYIGIASDELKRTKCRLYKTDKNNYKFPLVDWGWTEQDCIDYLKAKGLEHPLNHYFKRTGCWLCPKQSMRSLKNLYLYYPNLWNKLKKYEIDSPGGFKPNFSLNDFEKKIEELEQARLEKG